MILFLNSKIKDIEMIEQNEVFEAVRRGYNNLLDATDDQIIDYFDDVDAESWSGHFNNIKGVLFEQEYIDKLSDEGIEASLFENTNHPATDIQIIEDGNIIEELQLKATDSVSYINSTLSDNPDITIVATTEIASSFDSDMVIDSEISNEILEEVICDTINPVSPIGFGLFGFGLLFGLPF